MEENTNLEENGSISGNDPETPDPGTGNQEENPSPAPQPGQEEEKPKPEEPTTEIPADGDPEKESGTEKLDEVLSQLDIIKQQSGQESPIPEFTDTLKELITVLSPKPADEETPVTMIPTLPDGYQDYRYPIEVQIEVQEKGAQYSMCMGFSCTQPSLFADEIADLTSQVESGKYIMARVQYVYETGDDGQANVLVYDYEHIVTPVQPEEPDEPTETEQTTLEVLQAISEDLQTISENTLEYQNEQREHWQEMKEVQLIQTAGIWITALGIFAVMGFMAMAELFRKWK